MFRSVRTFFNINRYRHRSATKSYRFFLFTKNQKFIRNIFAKSKIIVLINLFFKKKKKTSLEAFRGFQQEEKLNKTMKNFLKF